MKHDVYQCSASQIDKAQGCQRKWGWRYLCGLHSPQGKGAALGTECHRAIEVGTTYQSTVEKTEKVHAIVEQARPYFPFGQGHHHEVRFTLDVDIAKDLQIIGYIDYVKDVLEKAADRTLIIRDLKTTSKLDRAMTPEQMHTDVQVKTYAAAALRNTAWTQLRLEWVYVKTSKDRATGEYPPPHVVGITVDRAWAEAAYSDIIKEARTLHALKRANPSPLELDNGLGLSCGDYGGCYYWPLCKGTQQEQEDFMSEMDPAVVATIAQALAAQKGEQAPEPTPAPTPATELTQEQLAMAAQMFAAQQQQATAPVVAAPPAPAPEPAPEPEKPKRRGRPKKKEEPEVTASEPTTDAPRRIMYVGCQPDRPTPKLFQTQAYRDAAAQAAKAGKVPMWELIDYGKGPATLRQCFDAEALPSEIVVDMRLSCGKALAEKLYEWADLVVSATY